MSIELDSPIIGIIGDCHNGLNEGQENYLDYQFKSLEYHIQNIVKHTNKIIFLGDIFHNRKYISQITLNILHNKFLKIIKQYNVDPIFIAGNHDVLYKSTNDLCSLKYLLEGYTTIINDCVRLTFKGKELACCVPWINKENAPKLINQFTSSTAPYLFGHFEISGHDILPGIKCLHSQFDTECLMKFKEVISGHFHCGSRHANITYLGAPYEMNWSDSGNTKQSMVLNLETGKEYHFKNPYTMYDKIILNSEELPSINQYDRKNVKVYLDIPRTVIIEKFINSLTEISNSCNVIDNNALLEDNNAEISDSRKLGIQDIWLEYIEQTGYTVDDRNELTKIFTETYNSVLMETVQ